MATSTVPVDLRNPGQVFACLGLMEAAEALGMGEVEGGFDWKQYNRSTFSVSVSGARDPLSDVLCFLSKAEVEVTSPGNIDGPWPAGASSSVVFPAPKRELRKSDGKGYTASALPIVLKAGTDKMNIASWLEGDGTRALKLFAGQQVASKLLTGLLKGDGLAIGVRQLLGTAEEVGWRDPFSLVGPVAGRFGFDARGAWDAIRLGMSLDKQKMLIHVSPLVEILAVIGVQDARPDIVNSHFFRYCIWQDELPLPLARIALSSARVLLSGTDIRYFDVKLGDDKQYKKCFPAQED